MNKKKNPDLVRNISYALRLNKPEDMSFQLLAKKANNVKPMLFLREMATKGCVIERPKRDENFATESLLAILTEYRTNFKRLSNLIRARSPALNSEVIHLVNSLQKVINKVL